MRIMESLFQYEVQKASNPLETFLKLPLTTEYQQKIREFITDFDRTSLIQLSFNREGMETRKAELVVVHTLRHIGFLLSTPELNQTVRSIQKSPIKWTFFVNSMALSINRKKESGTLNEFIPGFSGFLKVDENLIRNYIDQENYRGMFTYLLQSIET